MDFEAARRHFGDEHVSGIGVEIGAGLRPVLHPGIEKLYFFDKRNPAEFEEYFGEPPAYELISLEGVKGQYPEGIDFITCHHVVEHIDEPISVLSEWMSMLRPGGIFYMSIPSPGNSIETGRLITPLSHVLEDYFFRRPSSSYESKQHIYSFVNACTASGGSVRPWFADNTTQDFAKFINWDVGRRDDHDLHWHTYDLETARQLVEISCFVAGGFAEALVSEETDDSHYVLIRKGLKGDAPEALRSFHNTLIDAAGACSRLIRRAV